MSQRKLCLGTIAAPHGVRGLVRVRSYTEDPATIGAYGPLGDETGSRQWEIEIVGKGKDFLIVRLSGVVDRDAAERLRGQRLYVDRAALPPPEEDAFYHADLVGLRVETADGAAYGEVASVANYGAGDVVEIVRVEGQREMLPFTRAVFPAVDISAGRLVVAPPEESWARPEGGRRSGAEAA